MARAVSKETKGIAGSLPSRPVPTDNLGKPKRQGFLLFILLLLSLFGARGERNGLVLRLEFVSWVGRVSSWFLDLAEWTLSAGTFYQIQSDLDMIN